MMKSKIQTRAICANAMFAFVAVAITQSWAGPLDEAWIRGTTDKRPVEYKVGEKMTFTLTPQDVKGEVPSGEYFLEWSRGGDDGIKDGGKVPFDGKTPFVYSTKIDRPGFVRIQAKVVDRGNRKYIKQFTGDITTPEGKAAMNRFERTNRYLFFDGGAGADIEKLEGHQEPTDFDAFWAKQFKRLDLVPIKPEMIEIKSGNPAARIYAVSVPCAGLRPVTGYLTVPKAVDNGATFGAVLTTHGYSGTRCVHQTRTWASDKAIEFEINAHGLKLVEFGATDADTKALRWEISPHDPKATVSYAFDQVQNADPEVAYFNGMVLRVKRALQFLKTVKGWDGKNLTAQGGSQGGLQTIWAAGCGEGVTRADSCITWCCDIYTNGGIRHNEWQKYPSDRWYIPWTEALGYYDAINFAKRIPKTCQTTITRAGLGDYCCPPTGLAKMWNAITAPKKIVWVQGSQHGYVPPRVYDGRDTIWEAPAK